MVTNSRVGTVTNLEDDGSYDLLIVSFPSGFPEGGLGFDITNTPRKTTGVQKIAQAFLYSFLTTKGSDPVKPNFGTEFTNYIVNSNRDGDLDSLASTIHGHVLDAEQQTKANFNSINDDLSSQVASIRLIGVDGVSDSITVSIQIITRSGETARVAIPFPQLDLGLSDG